MKPSLFDAEEDKLSVLSKHETCMAFPEFDSVVGASSKDIRGKGFGMLWYSLSSEQVGTSLLPAFS